MTNSRFRILLLLGVLLIVFGGIFIGIYIWEAFIVRIGEPDQSLLFWYLPILFIGVVVSFGGLVLLVYRFYRIREENLKPERSGTVDSGTE